MPWRPDAGIVVTKHFTKKYLQRWGWDEHMLREALTGAYAIVQEGKSKYEVYVAKDGYKKIIVVYENDTIWCITGSQGGYRV